MTVTPYLFFDGRTEEAIDFYKQALGAEVEMLMRYKESPDPLPPDMVPPGNEDKVMHACIRINGEPMMMSDGGCRNATKFDGFSLSVNAKDEAEADRLFDALAKGGTVNMPMGKTFWTPLTWASVVIFVGMVADKFGGGWMIIVEPDEA